MPSDETSPPPAKSLRLQRVQVTSLALLVLIGAINYIDRATLVIANPFIRGELGLPLSSLLSAFALAQLPAGPIVASSRPRHSECAEPQKTLSNSQFHPHESTV